MKRYLLLASATLLLAFSAFSEELSTNQAIQTLITTEYLSFGPVGFAGVISQGELAFEAILKQTNALELFTSVLKKAKPEGQMYALCGIQRVAPKKFPELSQPIIDANPTVNTMTGCLASEQPASALITKIRRGSYARIKK